MLARIVIVLLFALVEVRADYQQCLDDWSYGGGPNNLTYYKICELVGFLSNIEDNLDKIVRRNITIVIYISLSSLSSSSKIPKWNSTVSIR
jgi:hypothetical protein